MANTKTYGAMFPADFCRDFVLEKLTHYGIPAKPIGRDCVEYTTTPKRNETLCKLFTMWFCDKEVWRDHGVIY